MIALSSNHFSHDDQVADVLRKLTHSTVIEHRLMADACMIEFPEYNRLTWSGSWVDTEASGVDPDYMSWVTDWIENNTPVFWEDGEPWLPEDTDTNDDEENPS